MSAVSPTSPVNRPKVADRLTTFFFLATIFSVSFQNVYWNVAGRVNLADILALMFLIAFVAARIRDRDRLVPATTLVVLCFAAALLIAYLIGFFNVETKQALSLWEKGLTKFAIHFAFLAAGVAYLARRSERFYWRTLGWFAAGFAANAAYGVLQLVATLGGRNLDALVLNPITGGASSINIWGAVGQSSVYRVNALTGDANHLGVMLVVPLLLLTPVYLRLEPGHRLRVPLAVLLGFLLLVELATLSRSGLLGLAAGGLVLAIVYRRLLLSRAMLIPLAAVGAVLAFIVTRRLDYFSNVLHARLQTNDSSSTLHFQVYDFIPQTIHAHPLFGFGLNTFSVYFEFVTGRTKWGAHSYYVATVVETGLVGTIVFGLFVVYLFRRLGAARRIGRALAAAGDPVAARVRPVAWGLTAALVGTIAANAFYLTMQFYYFYALALMALATPVVFARRLEP
jgi:O-antigen ligase